MVRVKVRVNRLAIDIKDKEKIFLKGDEFECPIKRTEQLGNSVEVVKKAAPAAVTPDADTVDDTAAPDDKDNTGDSNAGEDDKNTD